MTRCLVFLALLLTLRVGAAQGEPAPGPVPARPPARKIAEDFLTAFRADDAERMGELAKAREKEWDQFMVVYMLLQSYRNKVVAPSPDAAQYLAAARRFADLAAASGPEYQSLPEMVTYWSSLDRDGLQRHHDSAKAAFQTIDVLRSEQFAQGVARARELLAGALPWEASAVMLALNLGDTLKRCSRIDEAEQAYLSCADLAGKMNWPRLETEALGHAAYVAFRQGQHRRAEPIYVRLIAHYESVGDQTMVSRMRGSLGAVYGFLGDPRGAPLLKQVIDEARAKSDPLLLVDTLVNSAGLSAKLGTPAAGLLQGQEALAICERARATSPELAQMIPGCRRQIGEFLFQLGRLGAALSELDRAEAAHRKAHDDAELAQDLLALGSAHKALGRTAAAQTFLERALVAAIDGGDLSSIVQVRAELASLQLDGGSGAKALAALQEAREHMEELGAHGATLGFVRLIAEFQLANGDPQAALDSCEQILGGAGQSGELAERLAARLVKVRALQALDRRDEAALVLAVARTEAADQGDRAAEAEALRATAQLELARGNPAAAVGAARQAIALQGLLISGLGESTGSSLRAGAGAAADAGLLGLLAQQAADRSVDAIGDEALFFVESGRALLLAEAIEHRAALREARLPPELDAQERLARLRVGELQKSLLEAAAVRPRDPEKVKAARTALDAACREQDAAVAKIQREARLLAAVMFPEPVAARALCESLPAEVAMVLYHAAGDRLLAIVARRDGLHVVPLGAWAAIEAAAEAWHGLLSSGEAVAAEPDAAAGLHAALIQPLAAHLAGATRLWISPDGALTFLPFEAMLRRDAAGAHRLVEDYETCYVPSATVGRLLQAEAQQNEGQGFLALGDPVYPGEERGAAEPLVAARELQVRDLENPGRLPGTADEVMVLAGCFPDTLPAERRRILLRKDATLPAFRAALEHQQGRLRVVHLACHGCFHPEWPQLTGLILGGGEVLSSAELSRLTLPADLAVFSACATANGKLVRGEGVVGLVRAGLLAGCPRIVVSQWKVDDRSTQTFMQEFYGHFLHAHHTPAAALRAVRLARIRKGGPDAQPFHWAAFVLWGMWN